MISAAWLRSCEMRSLEMGRRATKKGATVGQLMIDGTLEVLAHKRGRCGMRALRAPR
jgi:hypothetical protein